MSWTALYGAVTSGEGEYGEVMFAWDFLSAGRRQCPVHLRSGVPQASLRVRPNNKRSIVDGADDDDENDGDGGE